MAMTQNERNAAYERIRRELGVDRIGTSPDAPPLPPRSGSSTIKPGAVLPIESEIHGAQMFEYGEIWGRPGLDLRTRCFITVATLTALNQPNQLYRHINSALNIGITPEEVHEVLLHATSYCGIAKWEDGVAVANEVFVVRGILPAGSGVTVEPKPPIDHEQRLAARNRVMTAVNGGRVGHGPDAPRLKPLPGGPVFLSKPQSLEEELAFIGGDYGYGELWGREGLSLRIHSFITVALLQAMVQNNQLHFHINNALNIGITPEEIHEALAHVGVYHGVSGWHNAVTVARHVFEQHPAASGHRVSEYVEEMADS